MFHLRNILKLIRRQFIHSAYSHENTIYRQAKKLYFNVDCSGFVTFWLSKYYPMAFQEIHNYVTEIKKVPAEEFKRLYSFDFLDFFNYLDEHKSVQWQSLTSGEKLQKGDIVSFARVHPRARFGHIAVILEVLRQTPQKWVIRVCDSSDCLHEDDTRCKNMGIGSGIIRIYNPEAEVSIVKYSRLGKKYERIVRCGRLKELKKEPECQ
ncbi:MAG: hypothetical protein KHX55_06745 [Proteobacteria bacterium]|nr:hypothetical protein [Pseudomonadota bacterium]